MTLVGVFVTSDGGSTYRARILIEGARFPPFGFDITEISSDGIFVTLDGAFMTADGVFMTSDGG